MFKVQKGIDIDTWGKKEVFCSEKKNKIRQKLITKARKYKSFFDLYGPNGTMYKKMKKEAPEVRIKSIDSGKSFRNKKKLNKIFKGNKDLEITNIHQYAKKGQETFGILWLDYCGPYGKYAEKDIKMLPRIMQGQGEIYFTFLQAREQFHKRGTTRKEINKTIENEIIKHFLIKQIKTTKIHDETYKSKPKTKDRKTNRATKMRYIGFKYKKI